MNKIIFTRAEESRRKERKREREKERERKKEREKETEGECARAKGTLVQHERKWSAVVWKTSDFVVLLSM